MVVSQTVATIPTMDTAHGENSDMDDGKSFNWKETNIIGIKGAGGGRKRRVAGHSGGWCTKSGWCPGSWTRVPWRYGVRRLATKDNQVIQDTVSEVKRFENENPVELNCEQALVTRLVEVQEKKVMARVKAIEWNIKFEQKE